MNEKWHCLPSNLVYIHMCICFYLTRFPFQIIVQRTFIFFYYFRYRYQKKTTEKYKSNRSCLSFLFSCVRNQRSCSPVALYAYLGTVMERNTFMPLFTNLSYQANSLCLCYSLKVFISFWFTFIHTQIHSIWCT